MARPRATPVEEGCRRGEDQCLRPWRELGGRSRSRNRTRWPCFVVVSCSASCGNLLTSGGNIHVVSRTCCGFQGTVRHDTTHIPTYDQHLSSVLDLSGPVEVGRCSVA
eukprot:238809-Rhodomonas_salina.2